MPNLADAPGGEGGVCTMCGIVAFIGEQPAAPLLLTALRQLEYRGYDSAGIATLSQGRIERRRAQGKVDRLAERLTVDPLPGAIGVAHTRWATHGAPARAQRASDHYPNRGHGP